MPPFRALKFRLEASRIHRFFRFDHTRHETVINRQSITTPHLPGLALLEPDIPGNTGTLLRLAACTNTELHIVEPAGFRLDDPALRRAGLDYAERAALQRHTDWHAFERWRTEAGRRLILLTTRTETPYYDFAFAPRDLLLLGSESAGVPGYVHGRADARLTIPMAEGARSLNVALAGAMVLGEALRQLC